MKLTCSHITKMGTQYELTGKNNEVFHEYKATFYRQYTTESYRD